MNPSSLTHRFPRAILALCWLYLAGLYAWLAAYLLRGDWHGLLTPINALAHMLFVPLPLALLTGLIFRRRMLLAGGMLAALAGVFFWGGLFLPGPQPAAAALPGESPGLRVLTYNLFGYNFDSEAVLAVIRAENPDVAVFQELNPAMAAAFQAQLGSTYPYQLLNGRSGVTGMGVISKIPVQPAAEELPLEWVGVPQALDLTWQGQTVRLVNFHMVTPGRLNPASLQQRYTYRQQQAAALAAYAAGAGLPVIAAGDANSASLNDAYRTITTGGLRDAWKATGFGLGFTFPRHLGAFAPAWMTRIDHIFVSPAWGIARVSLAASAGGSDHRALLAELVLAP
jgi:endonuclease/exonuclease/phosphatase (EEP) superfamily protein YafD